MGETKKNAANLKVRSAANSSPITNEPKRNEEKGTDIFHVLMKPIFQVLIIFLLEFVLFSPMTTLSVSEEMLVEDLKHYNAREVFFSNRAPLPGLLLLLIDLTLTPVTKYYNSTLIISKFLLRALSVMVFGRFAAYICKGKFHQYLLKTLFLLFVVYSLKSSLLNLLIDTTSDFIVLIAAIHAVDKNLRNDGKWCLKTDLLGFYLPLAVLLCSDFHAFKLTVALVLLQLADLYIGIGTITKSMKEYLFRCGKIVFFGTAIPLMVLLGCILVNISMHERVPETGSIVFNPGYTVNLEGGFVAPTEKFIKYGSTIKIRSALRPSYYLRLSEHDSEPVPGIQENFTYAKSVIAQIKTPNNDSAFDWIVKGQDLGSTSNDVVTYRSPLKLYSPKINHYLHNRYLIAASPCDNDSKDKAKTMMPEKEEPDNSNHVWYIHSPNAKNMSNILETRSKPVYISHGDSGCLLSLVSVPFSEENGNEDTNTVVCILKHRKNSPYTLWYIDESTTPNSGDNDKTQYYTESSLPEKVYNHLYLYHRSNYHGDVLSEQAQAQTYDNGLEVNYKYPISSHIVLSWTLLLGSLLGILVFRIITAVFSLRFKSIDAKPITHVECKLFLINLVYMYAISSYGKSPIYFPTPLSFALTTSLATVSMQYAFESKSRYKYAIFLVTPLSSMLLYKLVDS